MRGATVTVHDIGHGALISVATGNGRRAIIDCGGDPEQSPLLAMNPTGRREALDCLVLSHPHRDHIACLPALRERFDVGVLFHNGTISMEKLLDENEDALSPPNDECVEAYYEYSRTYVDPVPYEESPTNPWWGDGCTISCFCNGDEGMKINDLSIAVFVEFEGWAVLYGGDLEEEGWEALLQSQEFVDRLGRVSVFIASHHGLDSGYFSALFDYLRPDAVVLTAGSSDEPVVEKYEGCAGGMWVSSCSGGAAYRRVVTTRNDGDVKIEMSEFHPRPSITVC